MKRIEFYDCRRADAHHAQVLGLTICHGEWLVHKASGCTARGWKLNFGLFWFAICLWLTRPAVNEELECEYPLPPHKGKI